jgi:hypothetical protein
MASDAPKLDVLAVARAAGLEQVANRFADDLAAAARAVEQDLADFPDINGTTEPWPPMRIRGGK